MGFFDLLAAVAAAGIAVFAVVAVLGRGSLRRGGQRGDLVRLSAVSGAAALVCAVMNILEVTGGGVVAVAVGNATNVFAPAMLWATARRLNARREIGVVSAGAASILMLAVSFVVSADDGILIKTAVIAVFCVLLGVEARRPALRACAGSGLLAVSIFAFAAFNVSRLAVALGAGMHSWAWNTFASAQVTSIASAAVILLMSVSLVRIGRDLGDDPEPGTRAYGWSVLRRDAASLLSEHPALVGLSIDVPELDLIRTAHGTDRADTVIETLVAATRAALPGSVAGVRTRDTVVALLPADTDRAGLAQAVRDDFAHRIPQTGYDDVPDVRITHRGVASVAALDAFLDAGRVRRRTAMRGRRDDQP